MQFTPRKYQDLIANAGLDCRRLNIFASVGVGKTSASYLLFDKLRMFGEAKRAVVFAPKRVALSAWTSERTKWIETFGHLKVVAAIGTPAQRLAALHADADITTINYENIPWLIETLGDQWPFDTVFADECFVKGTPIETPTGSVPIEQLRVGDWVLSAHGKKKVTHVYRKETSSLTRLSLSNGTQVVCTGTHLIWTGNSWTEARDTIGKTLVHSSDVLPLWGAVRHNAFQTPCGVGRQVLREKLHNESLDFQETERMVHGTAREVAYPVAGGAWLPQQGCSAVGVNAKEAVRLRQDAGGHFCQQSGWQRVGDVGVRTTSVHGSFSRVGLEPCSENETSWTVGCSNVLQARLRMAGQEDLLGSGWDEPQHADWETARHEKDGSPGSVRVDRVENIECRGLQDVWDLEVEDSHTYFAGGILVHNCTRLASHRVSLQTSKLGNEFMKGQGGKRANLLAKTAITRVRNWYNLTGSPAAGGLHNLWGQQFFLDQGKRLGRSFTSFEQRWFRHSIPGDIHSALEAMPWAEQQIRDAIADCSITIDARDWFPIEDVIERHVEVDLPPKAREAYKEMAQELYTDLLANDVEALNGAGKANKCRQIASGQVYFEDGKWQEVHDEKLEALRSIVSETNGENLLVAYQFVPEKERILKAFPKARFLDQNPRTIEEWNAGKIPMLVCHPASAGHGLSLQDGGRILVDFSTGWNLEEDEQVIGRIGPTRQLQSGYNRSVFRYRIVARNTIEDMAIIPRLKTKASVQESLLNALKRLA